jgi:hypothetical protein
MGKRKEKPKELEDGHTPQADFDRNRDGLYGGLPKTRDPDAEGPVAKTPHPERH